jgi:hypothetical protein
MAYSKLSIINTALLLKGQNTVNEEDDGSQEWNVCSAAYDQGAKHLLQEHDWKFATDIVELSRVGDSPDHAYEDEYARPSNVLQVIWVKLTDDVSENTSGFETTDWKLVGNKILVSDGGVEVVAKVVLEPDPNEWPPMFVSALQEYVFSGIEGGLKKNINAEMAHKSSALEFLNRAKTRTDQQEPKRALFKTRHRTARRYRRG